MSKENTVEELSEDIEVVGPGQILAEARIKIGLTQEQVADKLNFRVTLVKDIENEIFDKTLPATFNRGYLKNYAKLVNASIDDVIASYELLNIAQKQGAEMQSFSKQTEKQAENNRIMWISYLILAILIGATVMWWVQDSNKNTASATQKSNTTNASTTVVNNAVKPQQSVNDANNTVRLSETLKAMPVKETMANASEEIDELDDQALAHEVNDSEAIDSVASDNSELIADAFAGGEDTHSQTIEDTFDEQQNANARVADTNNASSSANTLVDFGEEESAEFTFSGDCWVNIYDATGDRIAWGIKKSGYVMNISGQAPFTITLGKPELVSIRYQNQQVETSHFSRGNIAKFTLPLESLN